MPNLELREIVWEITPKCNKRCDYCGSENILDKEPLPDNAIMDIAKSISNYGGIEVNLSGGEPATLSADLLGKVITNLRAGGCKVKILTNGYLFTNRSELLKYDIDAIGLSINTKEEIETISKKIDSFDEGSIIDKTVIITNFGIHNVFEFDKILGFVNEHNFNGWQIQLTQGKYQLNAEGIKYLRYELFKAQNPVDALLGETLKNKIVIADNLQDTHSCTAGMSTCGITYLGEVIGCLSERSWCDGGFKKLEGVINKDNSLQNIWESRFKDIRFGKRECCRDCIEYPEKENEIINGKITIFPEGEQPTE